MLADNVLDLYFSYDDCDPSTLNSYEDKDCENEYTNQAANCRKKIQGIASILSWTYPLRVPLDGVEFQYLEYTRVKGPVPCIDFARRCGDAIL